MGLPYSKRNWDGTQTERPNGKQDTKSQESDAPSLVWGSADGHCACSLITLTKGTERPPRSRHTLG